jgi:tRNA pseudouridine38-40 synthase
MSHFRLTLEYDGTLFAGWQRQAGGERTVQGALEGAVAEICEAPGRVVGAGRTDAGVHAAGQVAGVEAETRLDAPTFGRALNAHLPPDLAVVAIEEAAPTFHARFDASGKLYRYRIWNGAVRSPLRARFSHHVPQALDVAAMATAAALLAGTHDFASFQAAGSDVEDSVRTLWRVEAIGNPRGDVSLELEGTGFLRHMVRNVAGTLLEIGLGRRAPAQMSAILEARDRTVAGPTAPARGLVLVRVDYGFRHDSAGLERTVLDGPGPLG